MLPPTTDHILFSKPNNLLVRRRPNRRPRKRITRRIRINIKPNPRIIPLIQTRTRHSSRGRHTAAPSNLEVQALHIQLRAIVVLPAVQRNDLVADDVVAGRELCGQHGGRLEVVGDEGVGDPCAGGEDGGLGEFGPAEGGGGEGCAVACSHMVISYCLRQGG